MVYLISYTLHKPGKNYEDLYQGIKDISGIWWHHTTSVWLIETSLSAEVIYKQLDQYTDQNDELIVFRLEGNWYGRLDNSDNYAWLRARNF